jgi:hypothetical protein
MWNVTIGNGSKHTLVGIYQLYDFLTKQNMQLGTK